MSPEPKSKLCVALCGMLTSAVRTAVMQGPQDERRDYIVSFLDSFEHPNEEEGTYHYCLVFEVLGMSLLEVLRANKFVGFPLNAAKQVMKQCLLALSYLHSLSIAHTDIKPENIMLHHADIDVILKKQLRQDLLVKLKQEEHDRLRPNSPTQATRAPYIPKTPGLSEEQIKEMQEIRRRAEEKKWIITPPVPVQSPIEFMKGGRRQRRGRTMGRRQPEGESSSSGSEKAFLRNSPSHPASRSTNDITSSLGLAIDSPEAPSFSLLPAHLRPASSMRSSTPLAGAATPASAPGGSPLKRPTSAPRSKLAAPVPEPLPPMLPDSVFAKRDVNHSPHHNGSLSHSNTPTPTKIGAPSSAGSSRPSPPKLSRALAMVAEDGTYALGAPLQRYPTLNPILNDTFLSGSASSFSSMHPSDKSSFADVACAGLGFQEEQAARYAQVYSRKSSPIQSLHVAPVRADTVLAEQFGSHASRRQNTSGSSGYSSGSGGSSPAISLSMGRNWSGRTNTTAGSGPGTSCTSPSLDDGPDASGDWLAGTYVSFKAGTSYSSASSGGSSFMSGGRGTTPGSQGVLPILGQGGASSSPIASKYGLAQASSTSYDAAYTSQSVFRPALIPHALLGTTATASSGTNAPPAKLTLSERVRLMSMREDQRIKEEEEKAAALVPAWRKNGPFEPTVRVKLADLGNAVFYSELRDSKQLPEFLCTRYYRAPENIFGHEYDLGIDVWALACTVSILMLCLDLYDVLRIDFRSLPALRDPDWRPPL